MLNFYFSTDYTSLLYSFKENYAEIINSKIGFFSIGKDVYVTSVVINFASDIQLVFRESIDFSNHKILKYVYNIYRHKQLVHYYDPQPHPDDPNLASTFPHHKHVPPNIKRNRQPAPGLSFDKPNLPFLIQEIIDTQLLKSN